MKLSSFVSLVGLACATPLLVLDALSEVAVPINIWNINPPDLPPDLLSGEKLTGALSAVTFESGRKGIRATLAPGAYRTEFEWGNPNSNPDYYRHLTGGELWVGFRMRVRDPGITNDLVLFQLGPVRDTLTKTKSAGYYQLKLRIDPNNGSRYWHWREFSAKPEWANPNEPHTPLEAEAVGIGEPRIYPEQTENLPSSVFNSAYESAWVAQLKMRTDNTGVVRLWFNGRRQINHEVANALPLDFTRVKWGPYLGSSNPAQAGVTAEYMHIVMAEGGGDDGYRTVAPGEWQSFTNGAFSKAVTISSTAANAGVTTVQVSGLPYGWTFSPTTRVISGSNSPLVAGARIMIRFMKSDNTEYERTVWIFPGDPMSPTADLDNDGVANSAE